jgi:hypothetical protein
MVDARFSTYYRRAGQFASAMKLCQDDLSAYASAAGLLAVHSAISYSDAVMIGLGGGRPHGENHREAIAALKRACTGARVDRQGIVHLQRLLGSKTDVSYGDKQVDNERIEALCVAAERFQVWAERALKTLEEKESS